MISFGKKITILRKDKNWSQAELAKKLTTSVSVIPRYEGDEMTPSIDAAKKLADLLETKVEYLHGENEEANLFKETNVLDKFKSIKDFSVDDKEKKYFTIDAMIHEVRNSKQYANKFY